MKAKKRFLFLQGVCSPFFPRLALALRAEGHEVRKVNFTVGDSVYWRIGQTAVYRKSMASLSAFYQEQYASHKITDIVLFGDCRPVHRPAIKVAQQNNIAVHVFEEGYFRPHWITLERDGVNGNSRFPRDPNWYRAESKRVKHVGNGDSVTSPFWKRAAYDVGYNFWAGLNPLLHRGVRSHVPYSPLTEYLGYIRRGIRVQRFAQASRSIEAKLITESARHPFYLMPLQLATDSQIVHHSPFADMAAALKETLTSFALHAPSEARFAAKIHPLDPGLVDYRTYLSRWATELGIDKRVFFLESGNLPALLSSTIGVITVNSTVGGSSLIHGRPTIALGNAIYAIPGLTFQGPVDQFWNESQPPDKALLRCFRDVVIAHSQVNGGYYSSDAISLAIKNSIPRLLNDWHSSENSQ